MLVWKLFQESLCDVLYSFWWQQWYTGKVPTHFLAIWTINLTILEPELLTTRSCFIFLWFWNFSDCVGWVQYFSVIVRLTCIVPDTKHMIVMFPGQELNHHTSLPWQIVFFYSFYRPFPDIVQLGLKLSLSWTLKWVSSTHHHKLFRPFLGIVGSQVLI